MKRDTLFISLTIYLKCNNILSNSNIPSPTKNILCLRHILFGKNWLTAAHFSFGFAMNMKECSYTVKDTAQTRWLWLLIPFEAL